jgi:hypothetical protein
VIHACDASPYHLALAVVSPYASSVRRTAVTADKDVCERVFTAVSASFGCFLTSGQNHLLGVTLGVFHLYLIEELSVYDGRMVVLQVVLDDLTVILHSFMGEEVGTVGLLCENVTLVFLVAENALQGYRIPL